MAASASPETPTRPSRRAGWHVAGGIAAWAFPLVTSIVAMPLLWRALGRDGFGVYVLAAGYAALAGSFGTIRGAAQRASAAAASPTRAALPAALGGAYLAALATGVATLVAATLLAPVFLRMAGIDPATDPSALAAFRLAGAAAPAAHLAQAARGILLGLERYGAYSAHVAATAVVASIGTVLLAQAGHRAPGLMLWLVVSNVLSAAAGITLALVTSRGPHPTRSWADGWAILRFGATLLATDAILNLYLVAERTVLTRAVGVSAVAEYTIPLSLASALQNALAAGAVVLLPRAGAAWALGDHAALRATYARAVKVVTLVALGGSTAVAGAAALLVGWWIEPAFGVQTAGVIAVLLAAYAVNALATPMWYLAEGAGMPARNTALSAGVAIVGISCGLVLAPSSGALGVAWARSLAMLSVPAFVLLGERAILGQGQSALWAAVVTRVVPAGLVLIAAVYMAQRELSGIGLLLVDALLLVAYAAWLWRSSFFEADERRAIARLIGTSRSQPPRSDGA